MEYNKKYHEYTEILKKSLKSEEYFNHLDLNKIPIISGIYSIYNSVTEMIYIGESKNINNRIRKHFGDLGKGIHYNRLFQAHIDLYSINPLQIKIIFEAEKNNERKHLEGFYITFFNEQNCYNHNSKIMYHSMYVNYAEFNKNIIELQKEIVSLNKSYLEIFKKICNLELKIEKIRIDDK